jgi:hypothetical protein
VCKEGLISKESESVFYMRQIRLEKTATISATTKAKSFLKLVALHSFYGPWRVCSERSCCNRSAHRDRIIKL